MAKVFKNTESLRTYGKTNSSYVLPKYDNPKVMCPRLPREIDVITAQYDYQGPQTKYTKFCPQDVYSNPEFIENITNHTENVDQNFLLSSKDLVGYQNLVLTSDNPLKNVCIRIICPDGSYVFWNAQQNGKEYVFPPNPVACWYMEKIYGLRTCLQDATIENQLHLHFEGGPAQLSYQKVTLKQEVANDLQKFKMIIFSVSNTIWITVEKFDFRLFEYDLENRIYKAHISRNDCFGKDGHFSIKKTPVNLDESCKSIEIHTKMYLIPMIFNHVRQINAIENIPFGWHIHESVVELKTVANLLQELYTENKYTVDEDQFFIEENGIPVVCDASKVHVNYPIIPIKPDQRLCRTSSVTFTEEGMGIGFGTKCDGNHIDDPKYISCPELKFPFIAFAESNRLILLDGKHITLEKEGDGKFLVKLDGKTISEKYDLNEWELFKLKYPGKYHDIGLTLAHGVTTSIVHQIVDEKGEEYTYFDGLVYQTFPGGITLIVEENHYNKAIKQIQKIRNDYKKKSNSCSNKARRFCQKLSRCFRPVSPWDSLEEWESRYESK